MIKIYLRMATYIPVIEIPEDTDLYWYIVNKTFKDSLDEGPLYLGLSDLAFIKEAMDLHYMRKAEKCL